MRQSFKEFESDPSFVGMTRQIPVDNNLTDEGKDGTVTLKCSTKNNCVMIIDTIQNASKYFSVHPSFTKAFDYINSTDLSSIEIGKYEIDGDNLKAIFFNKKGMTSEESVAKFECHNHHIDIQLCISGNEQIGWKPREKCTTPNGGYNAEKDVQLYHDKPDTFFNLTDGQFAIFFPEDVHAPMIGDAEIKKLVIKVTL